MPKAVQATPRFPDLQMDCLGWRSLGLAVVFAQRSSLDVSSECHDLHLASAAGPSSGPSANLSVALFLCVCLL